MSSTRNHRRWQIRSFETQPIGVSFCKRTIILSSTSKKGLASAWKTSCVWNTTSHSYTSVETARLIELSLLQTVVRYFCDLINFGVWDVKSILIEIYRLCHKFISLLLAYPWSWSWLWKYWYSSRFLYQRSLSLAAHGRFSNNLVIWIFHTII